ncbi:hypothetical protein QUF72_04960 [Desulfobacterales bacterium HSG2]|nr:hypothetical protein [Desulfobacterales bacterium HSG2]
MHADIRKIFNSCDAECAETPCLGFFGKIAEEIRDIYADLYDTIDRYPVLSFLFKWAIYNSLMDWDDLAEDIEIGSDEEFRRLVFSIAEKV